MAGSTSGWYQESLRRSASKARRCITAAPAGRLAWVARAALRRGRLPPSWPAGSAQRCRAAGRASAARGWAAHSNGGSTRRRSRPPPHRPPPVPAMEQGAARSTGLSASAGRRAAAARFAAKLAWRRHGGGCRRCGGRRPRRFPDAAGCVGGASQGRGQRRDPRAVCGVQGHQGHRLHARPRRLAVSDGDRLCHQGGRGGGEHARPPPRASIGATATRRS